VVERGVAVLEAAVVACLRIVTSSFSKPASADAVSVASSAEPMPKVRKVESRICVELRLKPGLVRVDRRPDLDPRDAAARLVLERAEPDDLRSTRRWSPIRLNWSTPAIT
jgi:hypothetical protein